MKILSGIYTPTSGTIEFEGKLVRIDKPKTAKELDISIIPQEFTLIRELTVYDNVSLGSELTGRGGLLDKKEMIGRTSNRLRELGVDIRPQLTIERLSTAQKQMVEICMAISSNAKLLIMDEPTRGVDVSA